MTLCACRLAHVRLMMQESACHIENENNKLIKARGKGGVPVANGEINCDGES